MVHSAYVQSVAHGCQLLLEGINDSLSRLAAVRNFDPVGGTGRNVDHILK